MMVVVVSSSSEGGGAVRVMVVVVSSSSGSSAAAAALELSILFYSILGCVLLLQEVAPPPPLPTPESSIFLCPLLSLSIPLPVVSQCYLSNAVLVFRQILHIHPLSATLCFLASIVTSFVVVVVGFGEVFEGKGGGVFVCLKTFLCFLDGKSVMSMFCNVMMLLLLYVHICVTRTG